MNPPVTVRQKAGSATWDHDGEIDARRDALVNHIFGAEPLSPDTEPQISQASPGHLLKRLYATRRKTPIEQSPNCQMERLDRALAAGALRTEVRTEARLRNFGRQWLDSAQRPHCRHVPSLLLMHGRRRLPLPASHRNRKMWGLLSCPSQAKDIGDAKKWRTIALFSHIGKAWSSASGPCQSLPDRSTRDAVAILENVFERFTLQRITSQILFLSLLSCAAARSRGFFW